MILDPVMKTHFLNLYYMALSDVEVEAVELEILLKIGQEKGVSKTEIDSIILNPDKINFTPPTTVLEKIDCLYDLARIAWADGKMDANEYRALTLFCNKFAFKEENVQTIIQFLVEQAEIATPKEDVLSIVSQNMS